MEKYNFCLWHNMCCNMSRRDVCCIELLGVRDGKLIEIKEFLINPKTDNFEWVKSGVTHEELKQHPPLEEQWDDIMTVVKRYDYVVTISDGYDDDVIARMLPHINLREPFSYFQAKSLLRVTNPMPCYNFAHLCEVFGFDEVSSFEVDAYLTTWAHLLINVCNDIQSDSLSDYLSSSRMVPGSFSPDGFCRCYLKSKRKVKAKIKMPDNLPDSYDETHPVFDKFVVFTGTLHHIVRQDAADKVWFAGGYVQDNLTKKTNILVVGEQNPSVVGPDGLSSKQKKAIEYQKLGQEIEYMNEEDFLIMMGLEHLLI